MKYGREKKNYGLKTFIQHNIYGLFPNVWKLFIWARASEYRNDLKIVDALDHILVVKIQFPRKVTTM